MNVRGVGDFIDSTIEDPKLRELDWNIAVYTFTEQWDLVLATKWRRAVYMLKG